MIEGIFTDGLIFTIMVFGILISYRILNFADMTCDGSIATGSAVATILLINGWPIILALLMSFIAGALCGVVTALIHTKLKIPGLLAGILTMTMLYSVNLRILGNRANVPLLKVKTMFNLFGESLPPTTLTFSYLALTLLICIIVKTCIDLFFRCDLGICIGALGGNEQVVISQAINPTILKIIGIGLSNGIIGLSGGLLCQYQGFADANLGQGMVVQGLAAIMIGEFLISSNRIYIITLRAILGALIYKALLFLGRKYGYKFGITPNDFKLLTGILVILSLLIAKAQGKAADHNARTKALKNAKAKALKNASSKKEKIK